MIHTHPSADNHVKGWNKVYRPSQGQRRFPYVEMGYIAVYINGRLMPPNVDYTLDKENKEVVLANPIPTTDYTVQIVTTNVDMVGDNTSVILPTGEIIDLSDLNYGTVEDFLNTLD